MIEDQNMNQPLLADLEFLARNCVAPFRGMREDEVLCGTLLGNLIERQPEHQAQPKSGAEMHVSERNS